MSRGGGKIASKPAKSDLPTKTCLTCGRPFTWRRKWARDWAEVRYCSDRCREARPLSAG